MEIKYPVNRHSLYVLSNAVEALLSSGIDIEVTLRSEKFLETLPPTEDLPERILADPSVVDAVKELSPIVSVLGEMRNGKWTRVELVVEREFYPLPVTCPFCGHAEEYVLNYIPYAIPNTCPGCGAVVVSEFGGEAEVRENFDFELEKCDEGLRGIDENGLRVVAVRVEEEEVEEACEEEDLGDSLWAIFHERRKTRKSTSKQGKSRKS